MSHELDRLARQADGPVVARRPATPASDSVSAFAAAVGNAQFGQSLARSEQPAGADLIARAPDYASLDAPQPQVAIGSSSARIARWPDKGGGSGGKSDSMTGGGAGKGGPSLGGKGGGQSAPFGGGGKGGGMTSPFGGESGMGASNETSGSLADVTQSDPAGEIPVGVSIPETGMTDPGGGGGGDWGDATGGSW